MVGIPEEFNRTNLISLISKKWSVLEIGPFTNPIVRGSNVKYVDVLDKAGGLLERARRIGYTFNNATDIHYVSPTGDLSIVRNTFDICISSHCVEHQPDLIHHLKQIERILNPGGRYFLIFPDKRYCFDHFIPTIADILDAQGHRVHSLRSVIEHRAMTTHNEPHRHWIGDHGAPAMAFDINVVKSAITEYENADGGYIDVHAWQFTPASFSLNVELLSQFGMTNLRVEKAYSTPYNSLEFCAILQIRQI